MTPRGVPVHPDVKITAQVATGSAACRSWLTAARDHGALPPVPGSQPVVDTDEVDQSRAKQQPVGPRSPRTRLGIDRTSSLNRPTVGSCPRAELKRNAKAERVTGRAYAPRRRVTSTVAQQAHCRGSRASDTSTLRHCSTPPALRRAPRENGQARPGDITGRTAVPR
ncbi:hypothetical protein GCM10020218_008330 [Dactylosporangium vinaceum]